MKNINQYKNRFNQLLESTMGNVKPLLSENEENKVVEINTPSDVPQSFVDGGTPVGYFDSNRATYDDKGQYIDIIDESNISYRLRNYDFNLGAHRTKGSIIAEYNSYLAQPQKSKNNENLVTSFNGVKGPELIPNNKEKFIGFVSDDGSIKFVCFNDKSGKFGCKKYVWVKE